MSAGDQLIPLRGPALRIAENMTASLTMPVATSQRVMPVKVIDENRRAINEHRALHGQEQDFVHAPGRLGHRARGRESAGAEPGVLGEPAKDSFRITRGHVNLGMAVDVAGKDGARSLKVPSIKNAQSMNFAQFLAAYDDLVARRAHQQADGRRISKAPRFR